MRPDRLASTPEEIEERDALRFIARRTWPSDWEVARAYEENPLLFPYRCTVSGSAAIVVETGEELPGSWHQQANGGVRHWTTVRGEFEAR